MPKITSSFPDLVTYLNAFAYAPSVLVTTSFINSTGHPSEPSITLGALNLDRSDKMPFKTGDAFIVVNSNPDSMQRIALSLNKVAYATVSLDPNITTPTAHQIDFYMV
jgi:hypothetical protein